MNTRGLLDQLLKSGQDLLQNQQGKGVAGKIPGLGDLLGGGKGTGKSGGGLGGMLSGAGGGALAASAMGMLWATRAPASMAARH